jgi:nicotinamidase-related amidase
MSDPSGLRLGPDAWLVVVDLQRVFGDAESAWYAPRFGQAAKQAARLVEVFGDRVVFTRFIAPERPPGAWQRYYDQYSFALQPSTAPVYQLADEVAPLARHTVDAASFGKWTPDLRDIVGPCPQIALCGVTTDCCVLSTALPAADAGAWVTLVTDACAGSDDERHEKAVEMASFYQPLISLATTDDVLAAMSADDR